MDGATATGTRSQFARICVQIDLEVPIPTCIWIGKWKQSIQIEGIDKLCFHCGIIGHRKESCPSLQSAQLQDTEVNDLRSSEVNPPQANQSAPNKEEERDERDPWTLVSGKRWSQNGNKGKGVRSTDFNSNL